LTKARSRVEKGRKALDKIITEQVGASSSMHGRLTKLDAQLKEQMNRIIERRSDGLTFHYKAIDQVRADGQQLVNQAMGGILQDSINEMGRKRCSKAAATRCRAFSAASAVCKPLFRMNGKTRSRFPAVW
jgi:23S rRNA maturation mini-RNase III